jgi:hypothetical protein
MAYAKPSKKKPKKKDTTRSNARGRKMKARRAS